MPSHPKVFQVSPGVFCVMRRSYFTCSYLCDTPDGLVSIDAGMKSTGGDALAAIAELGRKPSDVTAILLTHWHNDHSAGASELHAASGAPVYYHAREAENLTRHAAAAGLRAAISNVIPETGPLVLFKGLLSNAPQYPVAATRHVAGGENVCGFEVIDSPGHTAGHVSYFYRPRGALFAGDALAVIDGRLRFMARPVTMDLAAARESMLRLLALPIECFCPGHREPLARAAAEECRRMREYIEAGRKWPLLG